MKKGYLSEYFVGVSFKRLSAVDAETKKSNQHEIGTTRQIRHSLLGEIEEKFEASFIWFIGENETIIEYGELTHYDARKNNPTRSPEWRLYYTSNGVTELMSEGDSLFLAKPRNDNTLLFIITKPNSTEEAQLKWLFGIEGQLPLKFEAISTSGNKDYELDFTANSILEEIGIELEDPKSNEIDTIIKPYIDKFPSTVEFSHKARLTLPEVEAKDDPDRAIMLWLEHEDKMFKKLEQNIIEARLKKDLLKTTNQMLRNF